MVRRNEELDHDDNHRGHDEKTAHPPRHYFVGRLFKSPLHNHPGYGINPGVSRKTQNCNFDITPDDISQLNDTDLRELVGRLCEAELVSCGHSAVAVTWGGNQTAADGGLDVRVALPSGVSIDGFVPRPSTGFQVKKPDMPRVKIIDEMRPAGMIRPVIQELANEAGAYLIVSSTGSTTESVLRRRRNALREALNDVANAVLLHTDFYDRTRLATWVRHHPGLITWVKEKVGRALVGWHPYGPWCGAAEGIDSEYLLDDKLRLHLGRHRDASAQSVSCAIDELRDELALAGKIVRLVGLSGVGKTRFAQALFDARVGARPLPTSLAVYTNLAYDPPLFERSTLLLTMVVTQSMDERDTREASETFVSLFTQSNSINTASSY